MMTFWLAWLYVDIIFGSIWLHQNVCLADNQVQRLYRSDAVPRIRQKGGQALDSAHTKGELFLSLFFVNISEHMDLAHTKGELSLFFVLLFFTNISDNIHLESALTKGLKLFRRIKPTYMFLTICYSTFVLQDKANIRKELNDYKSAEMDVHDDSRHLTRCIFPAISSMDVFFVKIQIPKRSDKHNSSKCFLNYIKVILHE